MLQLPHHAHLGQLALAPLVEVPVRQLGARQPRRKVEVALPQPRLETGEVGGRNAVARCGVQQRIRL